MESIIEKLQGLYKDIEEEITLIRFKKNESRKRIKAIEKSIKLVPELEPQLTAQAEEITAKIEELDDNKGKLNRIAIRVIRSLEIADEPILVNPDDEMTEELISTLDSESEEV